MSITFKDKAANPIPTGVSELPLAINLKIGADPKLFVGRIEVINGDALPGQPRRYDGVREQPS